MHDTFSSKTVLSQVRWISNGVVPMRWWVISLPNPCKEKSFSNSAKLSWTLPTEQIVCRSVLEDQLFLYCLYLLHLKVVCVKSSHTLMGKQSSYAFMSEHMVLFPGKSTFFFQDNSILYCFYICDFARTVYLEERVILSYVKGSSRAFVTRS